MRYSSIPQLPLELAIIKTYEFFKPDLIKTTSDIRKEEQKEVVVKNIPKEESKLNGKNTNIKISIKKIQDNWEKILEKVKTYNHSIAAFLKAASPIEIKNNEILLGFHYQFHKEKINELKNRNIVENVIAEVLGSSFRIKCILISQEKQEAKVNLNENNKKEDNLLDNALKIFGGEIVEDE